MGLAGVVFALIGISWLAMVGICMLKDKVFLAVGVFLLTATALPLFGGTSAFIPITAALTLLVRGAVSYARPDSFWARRFYDDEKRARRASTSPATRRRGFSVARCLSRPLRQRRQRALTPWAATPGVSPNAG